MNANNWFNNDAGVDRPFVNANQWGASFGGPIVRDKTFFFINTEGLRVLLPTSTRVLVPSPEYQSATLANLATVSPDSIPFYNQMFSLWNNAPGASAATPIASSEDPTGCGGFVGPGGLGTSVPCALQFRSTAGNFTHEWLVTGRVDQNLGAHDRAFIHFRTDHGVQATYTDPINTAFNAQSTQPQYEGQLNETHTFGSASVNQFILSGSWYSALFSTADLAQSTALMPFQLRFAGRAFYDLGDFFSSWPQGRNVTQYQIVDDFSTVRGNHNFKFGVNFRRNDITDYSPGVNSIGFSQAEDLGSFFNGVGVTYQQTFPIRLTQPIALYGLGLYAQDEWSAKKNLRLTLSLRAQHDSNPVCHTDCFARFDSSFLDIPHGIDTPYNSTIQTGLNQALRNYTNISWQPRLGFAWSPFGPNRNTVLRGGIGLFSDVFPATVVDNFLANPPVSAQFVVGQGLLDPSQAGSQSAIAAGANSSFRTAFANGGTLASISASNPLFTPPSMFNAQAFTHAPQYQEWNLEFQQGLGRDSSLSLNYVGNHGIYEAVQNAGLNAFCNTTPILPLYPTTCASELGSPTGFAGLPTAPPDQRFGPVTEVRSDAVSNYNGLTVSFRRRFASLQLQANYTWSHALDEISNAGFLPFNFNTNTSVLQPQNPFSLNSNYGNSDYDVRHYFSLNYVYNTPKLSGWKGALGNWTVSGTLFTRTGYPYTVIDSGVTGTLQSFNYGQIFGTAPSVFANYNGDPTSCGRSALTTACPDAALFSSPISGFGNQRRNQIYGPSFFDTDLTIMKNFKLPLNETSQFSVGLQFFNLLNHPNFDQPVQDFADPQFGTIINTVNVPTSILGSFLGGDASPRLIQIKAAFSF